MSQRAVLSGRARQNNSLTLLVERAVAGEAPSSHATSIGLSQTDERDISIGEASDVSIGDLHKEKV